MWADYPRVCNKRPALLLLTSCRSVLTSVTFSPGLRLFLRGFALTSLLRVCDIEAFLVTRFPSSFSFKVRPVEAEPRDAASPQESLHPTETSRGPAAGRGGVSL